MKAHVIENGKVVNTIVVDSLDVFPNLIEATIGGIGWDYIDGQLIDNRPIKDPATDLDLMAQIEDLKNQLNLLLAK